MFLEARISEIKYLKNKILIAAFQRGKMWENAGKQHRFSQPLHCLLVCSFNPRYFSFCLMADFYPLFCVDFKTIRPYQRLLKQRVQYQSSTGKNYFLTDEVFEELQEILLAFPYFATLSFEAKPHLPRFHILDPNCSARSTIYE